MQETATACPVCGAPAGTCGDSPPPGGVLLSEWAFSRPEKGDPVRKRMYRLTEEHADASGRVWVERTAPGRTKRKTKVLVGRAGDDLDWSLALEYGFVTEDDTPADDEGDSPNPTPVPEDLDVEAVLGNNADAVLAYAHQYPSHAAALLEAERNGKGRKTVVEGLTKVLEGEGA